MLLKNSLQPLEPPLKRSLGEEIVAALREAIYNGQLAPNERLREEVLAEQLRVSRGPIREALAQLEREGLVIKQPNRSTVVARLSPEDLEEVYSLRMALELLAVRQAIRNADESHFAQMQQVIDTMAAYVQRGITEKEAASLDVAFHDTIYVASKHSRLYNTWTTLRPQVHILLLSRYVSVDDFHDYLSSEHQAILNALRKRDEHHVAILLTEHLTGGYERVRKSYQRRLEERDKRDQN